MYTMNHITAGMTADARRAEMLATAERKRRARVVAAHRDRGPDGLPYDRDAQRRMTARRLARVATATILVAVVATGAFAVGQTDASGPSRGGGGGGRVLTY